MAHLLALAAGLLMLAGTHASDVADSSMHEGFLSQYMGSDVSKTSLYDYNKFVTPRFNYMKQGGAPDALSHHNGAAEHGPATVFDKSAHPTAPVQDIRPSGLSAIGISLFTLAAMMGVRMRRGVQQATAFASSGGHDSDMPVALAPAAAGNMLELKTQESTVRGQVGWSQQSSQKFIKNGDRVKLNAAAVVEEAAAEPPAPISGFQKFSDIFSNLFPVWTIAVAVLGLVKPSVLGGIPTQYFTGLLAALMLSMGITLSLDDFKRVMQRPGVVGLGFLMCYGLMPAMAFGISKLIGLSPAMTAGMVLVGSINGGQASNLCTYIARGDVALSVLLTTVTTTGAIFMTPLLCKVLLGATVPVDALGVAISTIQVVLAPIVTGMFMNAKFPKVVKKIEPFSPIIGISSTSILVGSAVAQCASPILAAGGSLQLACALLHILGGVLAYLLCKPMGYDEKTCRTFAIETSM